MRLESLDDFIKGNFRDAGELAARIGVDRNTIYRLKAKGVLVMGTRKKFTFYHPKQSYEEL